MAGRCLTQFELRYIEGIKRPPGRAAIRGSGTHNTIKPDMLSKRNTGQLLPDEEIKDIAHDATEEAWEATLQYSDGPRLTEAEQELGVAKVRAATVDEAISLAVLHHSHLAPTLEPDRVEYPWVLDLDGYPVSLGGTIDLQEKATHFVDQPIIPGTLRDTKTAGKSPVKDAADKSQQLTMYSMAAWKLDGAIPPLALDHLILKKTPEIVTQTTSRVVDDFRVLLRRVEALCRAMDAGVFPPCNPDAWVCSPMWCGYYGKECQYTR